MIDYPSINLKDRKVYDYYREHRRKVSKIICEYDIYKRVIPGIFRLLKEMMLDSEGGIYIQGFGYFCFVRDRDKYRKIGILTRKKQKIYTPYFFPDREMEGWSMFNSFNYSVLEGEHKKRDHKLYFDLCESIRAANEHLTKMRNQ